MRLILALGAAIAATTVMAYAQTEERTIERTQVFVHHAGGHESADANDDGWISREESSAGAERVFARLDRNDDNRITEADRPRREEFNVHVPGPGHAPGADDDNCERTESGEGENRQVTIICRGERGEDGEVRRHVLRRGENGGDVIIRRHGDGEGGVMITPVPPVPPVPPMIWFLDEDSEADLNNDDAISLEEFRTQHLRMFDARDANGDGRVRAHRMPEPPTPPTPPTPPSPPRRG
jgi:hypothetical protein